MKRKHMLILVLGIACVLLLALFINRPSHVPWGPTGNLSILVRAAPQAKQDIIMGLGIDDMELYRKDGNVERVTVLSRRVTFTPGDSTLELIIDTEVPVGEYTGFGFAIKSPELRNAWEQEEAPGHIALVGESMRLLVPYTIEENIASAIILAFETQTAIHTRDNEQFFLPVVQIETRKGVAIHRAEGESGETSVEGGSIENSATFGMDWDGTVRFNFRAKDNLDSVQVPVVTPTTEEETTEEIVNLATTTATTTEEATEPVVEE